MKQRFPLHRFWARIIACVAAIAMFSIGFRAPSLMAAPDNQGQPPAPEQPAPSKLTPQQLQQLVAPIALYPDSLVAQILAASAYPTQIVEAQRFLSDHPDLKGQALADAVNQQDWDPSVKALTEFPSVLENMSNSLTWTSELGDANYNQPADVMDAIQYLRHQAQEAGNLQSTPQQTVTTQANTIVIEPADPQVVYVPVYNPAFVYGYPVAVWPGLYPWWGIVTGPYLSFGIGFGIGPFLGFGWGWHGWGFNWHGGHLVYGGRPYVFHSRAFYNRNAYFHGGFRGPAPFAPGDRGVRGFAPGIGHGVAPGPRAGGIGGRLGGSAFGGFNGGGESRGFAARGQSSLGGNFGGGFHGGGFGGGFHGGGPRR